MKMPLDGQYAVEITTYCDEHGYRQAANYHRSSSLPFAISWVVGCEWGEQTIRVLAEAILDTSERYEQLRDADAALVSAVKEYMAARELEKIRIITGDNT